MAKNDFYSRIQICLLMKKVVDTIIYNVSEEERFTPFCKITFLSLAYFLFSTVFIDERD